MSFECVTNRDSSFLPIFPHRPWDPQVRIVLSGEQYTRHCSRVQALGDARARLPVHACTCARSCSAAPACILAPDTVRPCARAPRKFPPCMHARPRLGCSLMTNSPARNRHPRAPACTSNRAPMLLAAPVQACACSPPRSNDHERFRPCTRKSFQGFHRVTRLSNPSRLFLRILRLGITFST
ncbi:hypothetical protein CRG98_029079 [Punica granatum]|uniref:Uncharacterized protein n=1 Tax=Punica granatum TaxID=22663 RepID=A0A2I0J2R1_PUNGR|nr:hypothetical protein CRG98_029079 [Punica granatum]